MPVAVGVGRGALGNGSWPKTSVPPAKLAAHIVAAQNCFHRCCRSSDELIAFPPCHFSPSVQRDACWRHNGPCHFLSGPTFGAVEKMCGIFGFHPNCQLHALYYQRNLSPPFGATDKLFLGQMFRQNVKVVLTWRIGTSRNNFLA
jgi:hypothetical protein